MLYCATRIMLLSSRSGEIEGRPVWLYMPSKVCDIPFRISSAKALTGLRCPSLRISHQIGR